MSSPYDKIIRLIDSYQSSVEEGYPTIRGRSEALKLSQLDDPKDFEKKFHVVLNQRGVPDWSDEEGKGILFPMITCLLQEASNHRLELMTGVKNKLQKTDPLTEEPKVLSVPSKAQIPGMEFTPQPTYLHGIKNEHEWNERRDALWVDTFKRCWMSIYSYEKGKTHSSSEWVRKHLHIDNIYLIHLLTLAYPPRKFGKSKLGRMRKVYLSAEKVPMWAKLMIARI